jgi:predicted Rossmann fold flavoprotein
VAQPERFVTDSSPNTLRKILRSWPLTELRAFLERELGMALELEEETGKLFPTSHQARDVRDGFVRSVREAGTRIWFAARVTDVSPSEGGWTVEIEGAPPISAGAVVIATGGLSVPATGSDGAGLRIAQKLGHTVHETYPALTPLLARPHPHGDLAGVSTHVAITAPGSRPAFRTAGGFLVTHEGWSGPAVLDASHLAARPRPDGARQELAVSWTERDAAAWDERLRHGQGTIRAALVDRVPRRLADALAEECAVDPETSLAQLRRDGRLALIEALTAYRLPWTGNAGYKKAEVTGGGVALSEIDPRTMESRRAPGLFLCGEVLDAFGPIGGHNFHWAWTTGRAAGEGAARSGRS